MTPFSAINFPRHPLIMGIVNVNDDSFSGDGSLDSYEIAQQCRAKIAAGADIIDLGAESARTNREAISEEEEVARLLPVLERWQEIVTEVPRRDAEQLNTPVLSINTWRPQVIESVLNSEFGSQIGLINDMSALAYPETLEIMRNSAASLLIMHSVGLPKQDHSHLQWQNVVDEMKQFFTEKLALATAAGIDKNRLVIDPGLDFAKSSSESLQVLQAIDDFSSFGCPVLIPLSRKQFVGDAIGEDEPVERDAGTVACLPSILGLPASIVRVHNVAATWQALKTLIQFNF